VAFRFPLGPSRFPDKFWLTAPFPSFPWFPVLRPREFPFERLRLRIDPFVFQTISVEHSEEHSWAVAVNSCGHTSSLPN
jgi:hypothetical protein